MQSSCWEQFPKLPFLFESPPFYDRKPFSFSKTKGRVDRAQERKPHVYAFGGFAGGIAACIAQNTDLALGKPLDRETWPQVPHLGSSSHGLRHRPVGASVLTRRRGSWGWRGGSAGQWGWDPENLGIYLTSGWREGEIPNSFYPTYLASRVATKIEENRIGDPTGLLALKSPNPVMLGLCTDSFVICAYYYFKLTM